MNAGRIIRGALFASLAALALSLCACDFFMGGRNPGDGQQSGSGTGGSFDSDTTGRMGAGWNLGNTLDANSEGNKTNLGLSTEINWGMPYTTQEMIHAVKTRGFKTIRIPVSWHNHMTGPGLTIDPEWLSRVRQIVDWALGEDMFVIINIHHDNLTSAMLNSTYGFTVNTNQSEQETSLAYIKAVWRQVAECFKDYGDALIFEVLNEPRNRDAQNDGFTAPVNLADLNKVISRYNQAALDTIRDAGGKNRSRYVMVPMYAASPYDTNGWTFPADSAQGRVLVSAHAYTPYEFCMSDTSDKTFETNDEGAAIDYLFSMLKDKFTDKGYGVVIGEASATDKNNTAERLKWFDYYCNKAKDCGISMVLWDNMTIANESGGTGNIQSGECHGYFNRNGRSWYFPTLVEKMTSVLKDAGTGINVSDDDGESTPGGDTSPLPDLSGLTKVYNAEGDELTISLPVNHYKADDEQEERDHGVQFADEGSKYIDRASKGDSYTIVMKGTATDDFTANVQFLTEAWSGLGTGEIKATFTKSLFEVRTTFTFNADTENGFRFVINNSEISGETRTLNLTEFAIYKK